MRGEGRLRRFPGSRYWHIVGSTDGKRWSESTREEDYERAERVRQKRLAKIHAREAVPNEGRVRLADGRTLLERDYRIRGHRSNPSYSWQHIEDFFGAQKRLAKITAEDLDRYVAHRLGLEPPDPSVSTEDQKRKKAARGSVGIELALLHRAYTLAVEKKQLGRGCVPVFPKLAPGAARQGFFTRSQVEDLISNLDDDLADLVQFLFYSAWRVGEARQIEWRDYNQSAGELRLREELSKNGEPRVLPIVGELARIVARRTAKRRLDCPRIFHREGQPIGDFRKAWKTACKAVGQSGRIVHDLRRSGVKHLIDAGVDPHTVMAFSGHRTASMLRRYHIINLDDLRRAALRGSAHTGEPSHVSALNARNGRRRQQGGE